MYASLEEMKMAMLSSMYNRLRYYNRVTRSPRKGRLYRIQQIKNRNGFVVKQIIHVMN